MPPLEERRPITVVDARMGRGKTSAAIRYMKEHKNSKRFIFITPYLSEVDRICETCDFEQPDSDTRTKSAILKHHLLAKKNISTTHALFYLMDMDALEIAKRNNYSLIIDETVCTIEKINITTKDFNLVTSYLTVERDGWLDWNDNEYTGKLSDYKEIADAGGLYRLDNALISIMNPAILYYFSEVIMLTYLFDGQYQKAYFDFFDVPYQIVGVVQDESGYKFSDKPDMPPPMDIKGLITIIDTDRMNRIGDEKYALSKNWYLSRKYEDEEICALRRHLHSFYRRVSGSDSASRIWTCYKQTKDKLIPKNGRYRQNYLAMNIRATNEYKDACNVAYMVNRFCDPNIAKFFSSKGIKIDNDAFALSEMIQFIWRSAIRDNKPINLYIPSKRMRTLLINWLDDISQGGNTDE